MTAGAWVELPDGIAHRLAGAAFGAGRTACELLLSKHDLDRARELEDDEQPALMRCYVCANRRDAS